MVAIQNLKRREDARTRRAGSAHSKTSRERTASCAISHEVLWECDAPPHRFHHLNGIGRGKNNIDYSLNATHAASAASFCSARHDAFAARPKFCIMRRTFS